MSENVNGDRVSMTLRELMGAISGIKFKDEPVSIGGEFLPVKKCPKCGTIIEEGFKACPECRIDL